MISSVSRGLRLLAITACTALLCAACASGRAPLVTGGAYNCGTRIPPQIRAPVLWAPLPGETQGEQAAFADKQSGKIDEANDRKDTGFWIVDQCEKEKNAGVEALTKRSLWQKITPWRE